MNESSCLSGSLGNGIEIAALASPFAIIS